MSAAPKYTNRLANETSPYLLQHAHNPVDWEPWGKAAFERAKREDKPVLLSIGYAACHWCHVMERESFESDEVAKLMNASFVCVKVDREERPDVDDIYMSATVAMSGSGGWPMTVFTTPEGEPFFAGTYFPPEDKWGRPGFKTLLLRLTALWNDDRDRLREQAAELTEHVREQSSTLPASSVSGESIAAAARVLSAQFDERWGGFGGAPKFPPSAQLSLLLRHHHRSGDERSLAIVTKTLDSMYRGGMYDHVGGGFARYSTDERWHVPHFEKMLYDNAQLARVYLEGFQVSEVPLYERVATETLDYVVREMQGPEGGYYSATDADSEGVEGKFFVWSKAEVDAELAGDAPAFSAFYDVSHGGNWEDTNVLHAPRGTAEVAAALGMSERSLEEALARGREKLYAVRKKRVPPLLDDKILASWNGLMIGAMAEGFRVLGRREWLTSAERAASFVIDELTRPDGGLFRTARAGKAHLDAYLEDYAYLADALVDLYEAGGDERFLADAKRVAERMLADFADPAGGAFFFTAKDHERLLVRTREGHDGAIPSANAVAARALSRLAVHFARDDFREHAVQAIRAYGRAIERQPRAFATTLSVVDFLLEGATELAITHDPAPERGAFECEIAKHYLPNRVIAHLRAGDSDHPLLAGKALVDGHAALYVCRDYSCEAPVTNPTGVAAALSAGRTPGATGANHGKTLSTSRRAGHATAEGTARYAARFRDALPHGFGELGGTGLHACRLGFGGYRVDEGTPDHRAALDQALASGINVLDTSTNYTDGASERTFGEALAKLLRTGSLSRDEVIVVSKIGYVQGKNMDVARSGDFGDMVEYDPGCWHSIHPTWLEDQLDRSLDRLGLETLDVCLLHNPEYFFSDAIKRGRGPLGELRSEFYRRVTEAFRHFEREAERGRLQHYGVSSNTAVSRPDDREATSLPRFLEAARAAGGDAHRFRVLQVPMNLRETGAALEKHDGVRSVLDVARAEGVAVLVNRPLNAVGEGGVLRLADPPAFESTHAFGAQLASVERLESEYRREIASKLRAAAGARITPESLLSFAETLAHVPDRVGGWAEWSEIEEHQIRPRVVQGLAALDGALAGDDAWSAFKRRYLPELEGLLMAIRERVAAQSRARARALTAAIAPFARAGATLSQTALHALTSTEGVSTVLVGMRRLDYVEDAIRVLAWDALADPRALLIAGAAAAVE